MRYSAERLQEIGYTGYQLNSFTGNVLESDYSVRLIAWAANNQPGALRFTRDAIGLKVRVHFLDSESSGRWVHFIERDMTPEEITEAEAQLAQMGVTVNR